MVQANRIYSTKLFYKFTAMFLMMALLVAATGMFGLRQVNTVADRLQGLMQSLAAQEKMAITMKLTIQQSRVHLLEGVLYAKSVDQFEGYYVNYELQRGWFTTFTQRLLKGNPKLKLEPAAPGSIFEKRVLGVQARWNDFELLADKIRTEHEQVLAAATDSEVGTRRPQQLNRLLKDELSSVSEKVTLAIDDLLVAISAMQADTKNEIVALQHHARTALMAAGSAAIVLAIILGILVTRGIIVNLTLIMARLEAIARGERDADNLLTIKSTDEIALVATGINHMLLQLIERDREIEKYNKNLEGLVATRTEELSQANIQLSNELIERQKMTDALVVARQCADEANRMKSEFLANMSHEIRTPMNAILGFSELLEEYVTDPLYKGYLDGIQVGGKNLLKLINDILDLSKIEAGKLEFHPEVVNPGKLLNEIVQIFSVTAGKKGLTLTTEISPRLPRTLILDETRVRQVLLNLVGNAIKFTHQGGITIRVDTTEHEDDPSKIVLTIAVRDTGIGIDASQQEIVFEAFRQHEGQNTRKYGGTGLGLTITKRLVEMMQGTISVTSAPGQGSTFTIQLNEVQVAAMADEEEETTSSLSTRITFQGQKVLLVEDIESNRQVVHGFLRSRNLQLQDAVNGQEGVAMAEAERPDLILMDIQMPVMDGYTAVQILKGNPDLRSIPVIALTASVMAQDVEKMREIFDGYVRKPVSRQELVMTLTRFLSHDQGEVATAPETAVGDEGYRDCPSIRLPADLFALFKGELEARWRQIKELMMNDEVEEFGTDLATLGSERNIPAIAVYGKELAELASSFQLDKMATLFDYFQVILQKIEEE